MSDIAKAFDHGKAFIAFVTCGVPDLETTGKVIKALAENGADLIELGIPFSDPTAEGPVIMDADKRALDGGVTTDDILEFTRKLREDVKVPMLYMTYANVVYHYGAEEFCRKASEAGVSGLILPDVPFEEKGDFDEVCWKYGIDLISMVAPTSEDRIATICSEARGFVYVVSSLGVTGTRTSITTDLKPMIGLIRSHTDIPCAIGFGISTPEQCREMASLSDGSIVGSGIVKIIAKHGRDSAGPVGEYVKGMKDAIRDL
ncbi:MAG: tryptophan synthase subunit alpha [Candidatus Methanomethylophilaceae archaeon]|nr:tryptophan synthase subunit alpha [Candidatus Methanomethylophilaceae archaeon]